MTPEQILKFKAMFKVPDYIQNLNKLSERFKPAIDAYSAVSWIKDSPTFMISQQHELLKSVVAIDQTAITRALNTLRADNLWAIQAASNFKPVFDTISVISYKSILDKIGPKVSNYEQYFYQDIDLFESEKKSEKDDGEGNTNSISSLILNETDKIREIMTAIYLNNKELYKLDPRRFEEMIAELLRNDGYKVELTKQTRDGGRDLIALYPTKGLQPTKLLVECKRYAPTRPIGVGFIRSFRDVIQYGGHRGLIVTTSYLTRDSKDDIKKRGTPYQLEFKEKDDIMKWVSDYLGRPLI